tara:strand:+ start:1026 stop:1604 length:579 start_codon:yes stop_codon:yes gene_type:complete
MARNITTAFNNAVSAQNVIPFFAVSLAFNTGTLYLWNGYGDISLTAGGSTNTYTGLGDASGLSPVDEQSAVQASGANLVLNGVKSSLISTALSAQYTNRDGKIFLGMFDTSKNVVADVYTLFVGKMDVMIIRETGDTSTIELKLENRLISLERAIERRYTDEDQKNLFPGDKGFEFIPDLQDKQLVWGKKSD